MYGIKLDEDLKSLVGSRLIQICIGSNSVILNFDNDDWISIDSLFMHMLPSGDLYEYKELRNKQSSLTLLLDCIVENVRIENPKRLVIIFNNNHSLFLLDDSDHYESFQIKLGEKLIVV